MTRLALFIDPISHHFSDDRLFAVDDPRLNRDDALAPFGYLKRWFDARGVLVHTADQMPNTAFDRSVYISLGARDRYRGLAGRPDVIRSAYFAWECPVVEPRVYSEFTIAQSHFNRLFSYADADSLRPFLRGPVQLERFMWPQPIDTVREHIWTRTKREFLIMINRNKTPRSRTNELYTERLRAVEFFSRTGEIDLYGEGWDGPPYQMGETWVPASLRRAWTPVRSRLVPPNALLRAARTAWRGRLDAKHETLGGYTFAICFENMALPGWITEKIVDCFITGTVPVYLGAQDVAEWVPPDCFIDMRRFSGYEELRSFLRQLGIGEIAAYREAARAYLSSEAFRPLRKEAFVELVARIVKEDTGVELS